MIIRIYAGDDGESHFEELTADQFAEIANNVGPGDITVGQRPRRLVAGLPYRSPPSVRRVHVRRRGDRGSQRREAPVRSRRCAGSRRPHRPWPHHTERRRGTPGFACGASEITRLDKAETQARGRRHVAPVSVVNWRLRPAAVAGGSILVAVVRCGPLSPHSDGCNADASSRVISFSVSSSIPPVQIQHRARFTRFTR